MTDVATSVKAEILVHSDGYLSGVHNESIATDGSEWPGGISPPGSPRTVRERLRSHGSYHSAVHGRTALSQPRVPPAWAVDPLDETRVARPLRSSRITQPSSLLRIVPPLCLASVLWSSWGHHLDFSLGIEATGSQVPCTSLNSDSRRLNAGCRAGSKQVSSALIPGQHLLPGFDITFGFRRFINGSLALVFPILT